MANNLILRIISAIVLLIIAVFSINQGGLVFQSLIAICSLLMLYEWVYINRNKRSLLFIFGVIYILIPMVFWIYNSKKSPHSFSIEIYWCFLIVWACDIFAYFGGKLFKGPKFSPKISPNKTWSGVITGSISAFIMSFFYIEKYFNSNSKLFIASIVMIAASILGDLLESKVKRVLQVKDTGNIIPAHGGICDRLDSFLLVTYIFIIIKYILL